MDFINLINGVLIPSSEIHLSSGKYGISADAKLSASAMMSPNDTISGILPILNGANIGNTGIYFARDPETGGNVAELEFDRIVLLHDKEEGIRILGGVISLSLDTIETDDGKKAISLSAAFLKKVTVEICQILTEKIISILRKDLEQNSIFNIKMLFHNERIILKGVYKKGILSISFSVEFAVEAKKNNIKISIAKINLASFGVPDFIIQNIIMEAIKKNLANMPFIKVKDNYLLVNIRQLIPSFLDYNPVNISIGGGTFSLIIDELLDEETSSCQIKSDDETIQETPSDIKSNSLEEKVTPVFGNDEEEYERNECEF